MDAESVLRHFERRGIQPNCPVCGHNRVLKDKRGNVALLAITNGQVNPNQSLEALALVCSNCGFVRLHAAEYLQAE